MSQLFFCLLSKTKPQPVLAGCRARFRSLHSNAPKPVLVQNCPSSAPECLSSAHSLQGQDLRRDNLLHVPPRDQPPGSACESPGTHRWTPGCISEMQNSQRVEQDRAGRGRRKQKVQEPLVRSVRTEFLPQGCLSCILCAGQEPWEVTLPKAKDAQELCSQHLGHHCSRVTQMLHLHTKRKKATKQLKKKKLTNYESNGM